MSSENRNALPPGHTMEGFVIERVLGAGGFGITYLARETSLKRKVAIKEYLPAALAARDATDNSVRPISQGSKDEFGWGLDRFRQEAETLVAFHHPNIVGVHRFFEAHGTAYLVMQYIEGESLHAVLERHGTLAEAEIKEIAFPLLEGLRQVHRRGFLHRDIKPQNIYITAEGAPVLIDFGAARQALGQASKSLTAIVSQGYAPYEQYGGDGQQGPWTDIYALGATLYRAVAGKRPVEAAMRVLARVKGEPDPLVPAAAIGKGQYSPAFLDAVDRALGVTEKERPQSVDEFKALLERAELPRMSETTLVPKSAPPIVAPAAPARRKGAIWAAAAVAALAIGGGGYIAFGGKGEPAGRGTETPKAAGPSAAEAEARKREDEQRKAEAERAAAEKARAEAEEKRRAEERRRQAEVQRQAEEAERRREAEEAAKRRAQEEAARRRAEEEAARKRSQEEAERKRAEEEAARKKAQEEAEGKRVEEQDAARRAEEARRREEAERAKAREDEKRRAAEAKRPGRVFKDCAECPELVVLPAGAFQMGARADDPERQPDEGPVRRVEIERVFAMGRTEITFAEFDRCVADGACARRPGDQGWGREARPVVDVSWDEAKSFVLWLTRKTGHAYRLPTEAEWEYAARGGTDTPRYWGTDRNAACIYENVADAAARRKFPRWAVHECDDGEAQTAPAGSYRANPFGLHDMLGNVAEWVEDCWHPNYRGAPATGAAWFEGGDCGKRVLRGGAFTDKPGNVRVTFRDRQDSFKRSNNIGFRIVRVME